MNIKEKAESLYKFSDDDTYEFKNHQIMMQIACILGGQYVINEIESKVKELYDNHPGMGDMRTVLSCVLVKLEMLKK